MGILKIRTSNAKASRFRSKTVYTLTPKVYTDFIKKYPHYAHITEEMFFSIVNKEKDKMVDTIVNTRDGIELREGLGFIFIASCPQSKNKVVDYNKTRIAGHTVFHNNWNSNNRLAKIMYTNYSAKYKFQHREIWQFNACRDLKVLTGATFKKDHTKYVEIEKKDKVSNFFTDKPYIKFEKREEKVSLDNYDEFNFD